MSQNTEGRESKCDRALTEFTHDPLPDPQTHFRLLKIIDARPGQLAQCTLSTWPLDAIPPYCAISYTWGDPSDTTTIEVNKERVVVRRNCEYVLQQSFASDWHGFYWVDAICIDQANDQEKSFQVAMMGDLYKRAARVFACVGAAADDVDFLIRFMKNHKSFFELIFDRLATRKLLHASSAHADVEWGRGEPLRFSRLRQGWLSLLLRRSRILRAMREFLKRPYFSRVWVLQELFSGNGRVFVSCGMNQLPLESFLALSSLMELLLLPYDKSVSVAFQSERIFWRLRSWFHRSDPPIECDYHTSDNGELRNLAMTQRKYLFLGAKPHPRRVHLRQLLKHLLLLECEDPRDRIYGIRSLIAWSRDKAPIPDYNKDAFLLATEVVESLHCDKPSQNFYWHQTSMTYLIRDLSRALFVSCNSAAFESALHCRRRDAKVRDESLARIPIRRVGDIRWVGMKACDLFHMTPRESYMELCLLDDNEGRPSFFAPKDTQPDDYILTCEPSYKWSNPTVEYYEDQILRQVPFKDRVLVLRASYNSDRYHVLGAAYETTPLDDIFVERIDWKHFIIWWDAEDLLVHDWRVAQYDMNKGMDRQVDVCFGGRFSAFEGSTYAMGPFEPEVIKAKLDTDPDIAFLEPE